MMKKLPALLYSLFLGSTAFAQTAAPIKAEIKPSVASITDAGYSLAWSDEFDGSALDATKWDYRTDSKRNSTQLPENVVVSNGVLRLELKKENAKGKKCTGAGIISKEAFKYGYYEARLKVPADSKWHTSFWLTKSDGSGGTSPKATAQELDIIENDWDRPTSYDVTVHRWIPPHTMYGPKKVVTPNLSKDFHVYGCEFTPETVKFYFDGNLVQTVDATKFTHGDQNIWLTCIANDGTMDVAKLPDAAEFDYVRFFSKEPQSP
jgi:beta-glucanase (GH16 family)